MLKFSLIFSLLLTSSKCFSLTRTPTKIKYFNDPRIHNMGNIGFGGWVHAQLAPYATKYIDNIRYGGTDIRGMLIKNYQNYYKNEYNSHPKMIDMCCGIGISTMINQTGIDTSIQMINKAKSLRNNKNIHMRKNRKIHTKFKLGNAENYGKYNEYHCSTIMFALHEMPLDAQQKVINNCLRISSNNVLIMDISPTYQPSDIMISGEPYLYKYLNNINSLMKFYKFNSIEVIPNHVKLWYYSNPQ